MRRALVVWLGLMVGLMGLLPVAASAGLDPKTDSIGVYFDVAGNSNCATATPFVPFPVYILLMNPAGITDGFECTVTPVGAPYFVLGTDLGAGALDVDGSPNGYAVGAASPYPMGPAMKLATLNFMVQAATPVDFYITKATSPSIIGSNMPAVSGEGILRGCQIAACNVSLSVATINGGCPVVCGAPTVPPYDLAVAVTANANGLQDAPIQAATMTGATDGHDGGIDIPKPAPPPGDYVMISFEHAQWPVGPRFATDIRARYDHIYENRIWPLLVETDVAGEVVLEFTPDFNVASGIKLHLKDLQTGQYHNLFPDLSYVFENDGLPNSYRFELMVGAAPVPPSLNPAHRAVAAGWSMVGIPLTPSPGATVGEIVVEPAPGYAYAYDYSRQTGYRIVAAETVVEQGHGYWLATDAGFTWTMSGVRDIDGVTVPLTNGWNLIGNAIWFPAPFEGLRVIQGGVRYDWITAAQMGLVSTDVQSFDNANGNYIEAVDLQPWYGYWINALQEGLALEFYYGNFVEMPKRLTARKNSTKVDDGSWQSDLTMTDAAGISRSVTFGMHAGATVGFDAVYDKPLPPSSPAGGPRLMFHHPEWQLAAGSAIARDLVSLEGDAVSWPVVATTSTPGHALFRWDPTDWPSGVDFQLYLPGENRVAVMSMRKATQYELTMGSRAVQFVIRTPSLASGIGDLPAAECAVSVSPNPFNPQTTVSFDLPSAGRAEVRVYSVRGELVSVLGGGSYEAGRHSEIWRGSDRQGRDVPSGSYFARLYIDGQAQGAVAKMSLVR